MRRAVFRYDIFILQYVKGEFQAVLITQMNFPDLKLAKTYTLHNFGFSENDVPMIMDNNGSFHYFHPKYKVWYKGLTDNQKEKYFSWLVHPDNNVPSAERL